VTIPIKVALGGLGAAGAFAVAEMVAETPPITVNPTAALIAVLAVVQGVIGLVQNYLANRREQRQRDWLVADREETKKKLDESARDVRLDLERAARSTAQTLRLNANDLKEELHKNTTLTQEVKVAAAAAYKEANNVNTKIAAVGNVRRAAPAEERRKAGAEPVK
jgi:hypothetical protein